MKVNLCKLHLIQKYYSSLEASYVCTLIFMNTLKLPFKNVKGITHNPMYLRHPLQHTFLVFDNLIGEMKITSNLFFGF